MALPAYQGYAKRAKMSELVLAASACRTSITEVYQSVNVWNPPTANSWGCESGPGTSTPSAPTKYVAGVTTTADGKVTVTAQGFGDALIDGNVLTLTPMATATTPAVFASNSGSKLYGWRCGATADGTTIPAKFLPGSCRG